MTLTFAIRPKNPCICNLKVHTLFCYISLNVFFQKLKTANIRGCVFDIKIKRRCPLVWCVWWIKVNFQIDIGTDLHQKTLRAAQRYLSSKENVSNIFDEAQLSVFKELLPYWAGFRKSYSPPDDPNKKPGMQKCSHCLIFYFLIMVECHLTKGSRS